LRSIQLKGTVTAVEPVTDEDHARAARFADEFFTAIHETDGTEVALVERMQPYDYVACTIVVDDLYDQTPGPGAGGRLTAP
jgi:hypothetical protein